MPTSFGSSELILLAAIVSLLIGTQWIPQLRPALQASPESGRPPLPR